MDKKRRTPTINFRAKFGFFSWFFLAHLFGENVLVGHFNCRSATLFVPTGKLLARKIVDRLCEDDPLLAPPRRCRRRGRLDFSRSAATGALRDAAPRLRVRPPRLLLLLLLQLAADESHAVPVRESVLL